MELRLNSFLPVIILQDVHSFMYFNEWLTQPNFAVRIILDF